jgi:hypothetical protein
VGRAQQCGAQKQRPRSAGAVRGPRGAGPRCALAKGGCPGSAAKWQRCRGRRQQRWRPAHPLGAIIADSHRGVALSGGGGSAALAPRSAALPGAVQVVGGRRTGLGGVGAAAASARPRNPRAVGSGHSGARAAPRRGWPAHRGRARRLRRGRRANGLRTAPSSGVQLDLGSTFCRVQARVERACAAGRGRGPLIAKRRCASTFVCVKVCSLICVLVGAKRLGLLGGRLTASSSTKSVGVLDSCFVLSAYHNPPEPHRRRWCRSRCRRGAHPSSGEQRSAPSTAASTFPPTTTFRIPVFHGAAIPAAHARR